MRVHACQRASSPVLRRFWEQAGCRAPEHWEEIPPVPTSAFKDAAFGAPDPEAVFRTSGTTGGRGARGEHRVASLDLYRAAARGPYRRHLFPGLKAVRLLSLVPNPTSVPDSSLGTMAGFISREPEVSGAVWAFDPETGVDVDLVRETLDGVSDIMPNGQPVLLLATSFALVQLLDNDDVRLPPGSRIMETGGFKGRTAEVDRGTLYRRIGSVLGVPESHLVNEYGMTEMLSQAYDAVADGAPPLPERVHRFPPWVRTRALDPVGLDPLPPEQPGLLAHFDLANAGSICHLLTEDLGATTSDGGFRLLGRATGALPRGCSLTAEAFVRAAGREAPPAPEGPP